MVNLLGRTVLQGTWTALKIMRAGSHQFRLVTLIGRRDARGGSMTVGRYTRKRKTFWGATA
jgi:chromosome segregation ATPase